MWRFQGVLRPQSGLSRCVSRMSSSLKYTTVRSDVPINPIDKLVIANRGEIACRVMKTARKMGVKTVAVYSEADKYARHVSMADESYLIGPAPAAESYLKQDVILDVAKRSGAQAVHPGYGFLSENESFAVNCSKEGVIFVGPPVPAITAMGSKSASKEIMENASVPCVPGYHGTDQSVERFQQEAERIGFPVILKAVLGGGGKGMRIVESADELEEALNGCRREALSSFGDDRVLIEKYLRVPRHIEFQVFADKHDNIVHLFERDCSLQRRHQKVIEEAPAPGMSTEWRNEMGQAAVNAARAVGYEGAGTVEFIVDEDNSFYFMEMNTRLQVEHPVSEMITGQDLVEWQLQVAAGHPLPLSQDQLSINGHSFEARVYAEDPDNGFLPCTGKLVHLSPPEEGPSVRVETGVRQGDEVSVFYDPMIAKLVVHSKDRTSALKSLAENLKNYQIAGLSTNIPFLLRCCQHPSFVAGDVSTNFIPKYADSLLPPPAPASNETIALAALSLLLREKQASGTSSPWSSLSGFKINTDSTRTISLNHEGTDHEVTVRYPHAAHSDVNELNFEFKVDGKEYTVTGSLDAADPSLVTAVIDGHRTSLYVVPTENDIHVFHEGKDITFSLPMIDLNATAADKGSLLAPMPGKVVKVVAPVGTKVKKGDALVIMEAMKMEHTIRASADGEVTGVMFGDGDLVPDKAALVTVSVD